MLRSLLLQGTCTVCNWVYRRLSFTNTSHIPNPPRSASAMGNSVVFFSLFREKNWKPSDEGLSTCRTTNRSAADEPVLTETLLPGSAVAGVLSAQIYCGEAGCPVLLSASSIYFRPFTSCP